MREVTSSYRAFRQEANRLILSGLKRVRSDHIVRLARSARLVPWEPAIAALRQLVNQYGGASDATRFRLVLKALSNVFQGFMMNPQVPRFDLERLSRAAVSADLFAEPLPQGTTLDLDAAARGHVNRYQALTLLSRSPEVPRLPAAQLYPLLTNSSLAPTVLSILSAQEDSRRLALAADLSKRANILLRRGSIELANGLPTIQSGPILIELLADPRLARRAESLLLAGGTAARQTLVEALNTADPPTAERLVKVLRRFRDGSITGVVERLAQSPDPGAAFWARLALHASGVDQTGYLREVSTLPEQHQQRVFAKLELVRSGFLESQDLLMELESENPSARSCAAEAILELDNPLKIIEPILSALTRSGDKEARLKAVKKLVWFDDPRMVEFLTAAARDPFPEVRKRAIHRLVVLEGFPALEEHFDLGPVLSREFDDLSVAQHRTVLFHVLPLLRWVPDIRFARYLSRLTADSVTRGITGDFEGTLRPILLAFGEALLQELGKLAASTNPNVSLIAEEFLLLFGMTEAKDSTRRRILQSAVLRIKERQSTRRPTSGMDCRHLEEKLRSPFRKGRP